MHKGLMWTEKSPEECRDYLYNNGYSMVLTLRDLIHYEHTPGNMLSSQYQEEMGSRLTMYKQGFLKKYNYERV